MLKELDKSKGRINFPMLYIHRYLRFDFEAILYKIDKRCLMIKTIIITIDSLELMPI